MIVADGFSNREAIRVRCSAIYSRRERAQTRRVDRLGFSAGGETMTYLVYDPSDLIQGELKTHAKGSFSGIPCQVYRVRALESHWYTVLFYTDTSWNACGDAGEAARAGH